MWTLTTSEVISHVRTCHDNQPFEEQSQTACSELQWVLNLIAVLVWRKSQKFSCAGSVENSCDRHSRAAYLATWRARGGGIKRLVAFVVDHANKLRVTLWGTFSTRWNFLAIILDWGAKWYCTETKLWNMKGFVAFEKIIGWHAEWVNLNLNWSNNNYIYSLYIN